MTVQNPKTVGLLYFVFPTKYVKLVLKYACYNRKRIRSKISLHPLSVSFVLHIESQIDIKILQIFNFLQRLEW
jgi:hypothetical protein